MTKKKTALSALDKAFAIAGRFPSMVPGEFRAELVRFRSRHKDKAAFLGLKESPAEKVTVTPENLDFLERVQKKENDMEYVAVMRDLTLGFWYNQKVVYQFLPETLEYIKNVFKPEQIQVNLNAVIRRMCSKPIYIGLPNGSDIQGFFCSCVSLINETWGIPLGDHPPALNAIIVEQPTAHIYLHMGGDTSLASVFRDDTPEAGKLLFSCLSYLAITQYMVDAQKQVFVPYDRGNCEYYIIHPISFPDCDENCFDYLKQQDGWIKTGLSPFFNYISRQNMVKDFDVYLKKYEQWKDYPFQTDTYEKWPQEAVGYKTHEMLFEWEAYKTIYQYNNESEQAFHQKYLEMLAMNGFPDRLIDYMPYPTIVLSQQDTGLVFLISLCKLEGAQERGVFIMSLSTDMDEIAIIPARKSPFADESLLQRVSDSTSAMCALYHILTVLEQRTLKRLAKETLQQGDPSSTALVPVAQTADAERKEKEAAAQEWQQAVRQGDALEDVPFIEMFDLTPRTVKRIPNKTAMRRHGWSMKPHSRRQHPHRYWVGSGENKHLEVRWLAKMQINSKDKPVKTTTVHELK